MVGDRIRLTRLSSFARLNGKQRCRSAENGKSDESARKVLDLSVLSNVDLTR